MYNRFLRFFLEPDDGQGGDGGQGTGGASGNGSGTAGSQQQNNQPPAFDYDKLAIWEGVIQ